MFWSMFGQLAIIIW